MEFKLVDFDPDNKPQKGNEAKVKFKIGDRIRIQQNCMWTGLHGKTGTVYATNSPRFRGVLVKVDDFFDGHNGELYLESLGRKPESKDDASKWILSERDLYKMPVGDGEDAKNGVKKPARRIVVIEITDDGAKARYFNGGKIPAKEAEVRRYHKDKPNDELAAIHAVSKLFGWIAEEPKEDLAAVNKLKDTLVEVEKFAVTARESVGEALYKLRQIMK